MFGLCVSLSLITPSCYNAKDVSILIMLEWNQSRSTKTILEPNQIRIWIIW